MANIASNTRNDLINVFSVKFVNNAHFKITNQIKNNLYFCNTRSGFLL